MEENKDYKDMSIMELITQITRFTSGSDFKKERMDKAEPYAKELGKRLSLSPIQSILLSIVTNYGFLEEVGIVDLANHFQTSNVKIMCYLKSFEVLERKEYIRIHSSYSIDGRSQVAVFRIVPEAMNALSNNIAYEPISLAGMDENAFLAYINILFNNTYEDKLNAKELSNTLHELVDMNQELKICKAIKSFDLTDDYDVFEFTLLLLFIHMLYNDENNKVTFFEIQQIFNNSPQFFRIRNRFRNEVGKLFENGIIEIRRNEALLNKDVFVLTKKAKEKIFENIKLKEETKQALNGMITPEMITTKELFFNDDNQVLINKLEEVLKPNVLPQIQERLVQNGMRKGIACLLYGTPGTGKTESVYQIAKKTGRDLLTVNAYDFRDKWIGESEKKIKQIFDSYKRYCKNSDITPILLLNEADGILGIRSKGASESVDIMTNSVQNIILQELENIDGVVIATTNMTENLDAAFERRFIYKLNFSKPNTDTKKKIWMSTIKNISEKDATKLASEFDFSGGEIENIARKVTISSIIDGETIGFNGIRSLCKNERIQNNQNSKSKVGY